MNKRSKRVLNVIVQDSFFNELFSANLLSGAISDYIISKERRKKKWLIQLLELLLKKQRQSRFCDRNSNRQIFCRHRQSGKSLSKWRYFNVKSDYEDVRRCDRRLSICLGGNGHGRRKRTTRQ